MLCIIITGYKILSYSFNEKPHISFLQKRIIIAFSLVAAIPTISVATFSAYIFNFALQPWFDQKISRILDESIIVAKAIYRRLDSTAERNCFSLLLMILVTCTMTLELPHIICIRIHIFIDVVHIYKLNNLSYFKL